MGKVLGGLIAIGQSLWQHTSKCYATLGQRCLAALTQPRCSPQDFETLIVLFFAESKSVRINAY